VLYFVLLILTYEDGQIISEVISPFNKEEGP